MKRARNLARSPYQQIKKAAFRVRSSPNPRRRRHAAPCPTRQTTNHRRVLTSLKAQRKRRSQARGSLHRMQGTSRLLTWFQQVLSSGPSSQLGGLTKNHIGHSKIPSQEGSSPAKAICGRPSSASKGKVQEKSALAVAQSLQV